MLADFLHRISLRRLIKEFGRAGFAEMRRCPALLAEVDQHAATVRDMLATDARGLRPASLLDYLHGFLAGAAERGWYPMSPVTRDWESVRVLAVCWLARQRA